MGGRAHSFDRPPVTIQLLYGEKNKKRKWRRGSCSTGTLIRDSDCVNLDITGHRRQRETERSRIHRQTLEPRPTFWTQKSVEMFIRRLSSCKKEEFNLVSGGV